MSIRFLIIVIAMLFCICAVTNSFADDAEQQSLYSSNGSGNSEQLYILAIEIYGNVTTQPQVLDKFITFKTGDVFDTSALIATRANFVKTQAYEKVDILPNVREDGVYVFIVLKEAVRQNFGYSGEYGTHKHGREKLWWSVHLDGRLSNFRGHFEELSGGVSFWEHRGMRASWYKPFLSTPYFIGASAAASVYHDEWLPIDYLDLSARMSAGRRIGKNSQISLGAIPILRRRTIRDTIAFVNDTLSVPLSNRPDIYEAFGVLSFVNDFRNARFDPQRGWYLLNEIRTNWLYCDKTEPFVQYKNDFRYHQPLFFDDMVSLRFSMTLRDRDAGKYHRLLYGDAGQTRGYNQKELGWGFVANSSLLMSAKYHKPIFKTMPLNIPLISTLYGNVHQISYRMDATLIADYARIYKDPHGALLLTKGPVLQAIGLGGGVRIAFPEIRQSGCIDLVYGRREDKDSGGYKWKPVLHAYFDLYY